MKDAYIVTNHKLKSASIYFIEIMLQPITNGSRTTLCAT